MALMTAQEFVDIAIDICRNHKTKYVRGGQGQSLTKNWQDYFIANYKWNAEHAEAIRKMDGSVFAFDCLNFPIMLWDGFVADHSKTYGGATPGTPCPGYTERQLMSVCKDVSTDMDNILKGEILCYGDYSHVGIYVGVRDGQRMAAECTYRWADGCQLISIDREERKGMWKFHGQSPFVDYESVNPNPSVNTKALKTMVTNKVKAKKGDKGSYIQEIQRVLIRKGYPCGSTGADGDFGANTEKAVKAFQQANNLTADGIVGYDTITRMIGA